MRGADLAGYWCRVHVKSLQSCPTRYDSMDCSPPGSSVHGDSPGNNMKRIAMPSSRGSSWPREWTRVSCVSCIDRWILYHRTIWEAPEMPQSLPLFFCPPPIIEFEKLRHSFLSPPPTPHKQLRLPLRSLTTDRHPRSTSDGVFTSIRRSTDTGWINLL